MKISELVLFTFLSISIIACTSGTNSQEEASENIASNKSCTYSYVADSTVLQWTAYKFTTKVGVSGTFDNISVSNTKDSENILDVLVGAEFSIQTSTVNSGNAERDPKLVAFFFKQLVNTENITGKIVSVTDAEAVVSITMNDKTVDAVGKISIEGEKVSLSVSVDMNDFEGIEAINTLNEACSLLHTSEDGESKLWPDVSIVVSTVLKKECK